MLTARVWPEGGEGRAPAPAVARPQELPDQQPDPGDVAAHLEHRVRLLRVREVEGEHGLRPHVLLPDDACGRERPSQSPRPPSALCALLRPALPWPRRRLPRPGPGPETPPWGPCSGGHRLREARDKARLRAVQEALTCAHGGAAEQQRQAPHALEGAEVVHALVQAVHPVLVLRRGHRDTVSGGGA